MHNFKTTQKVKIWEGKCCSPVSFPQGSEKKDELGIIYDIRALAMRLFKLTPQPALNCDSLLTHTSLHENKRAGEAPLLFPRYKLLLHSTQINLLLKFIQEILAFYDRTY